MKIVKYISIVSIFITCFLLFKKLEFDIKYIDFYKSKKSNTVASGSVIVSQYYMIAIPISLLLSIIGFRIKSLYSKFALYFNLGTLIYFAVSIVVIFFTLCNVSLF